MKPLQRIIRAITTVSLAQDFAVPSRTAATVLDQVAAFLDTQDTRNPSVEDIHREILACASRLASQSTDGTAIEQHQASLEEPYRSILALYRAGRTLLVIAAQMHLTEAEVHRYLVRGLAEGRMQMRSGVALDQAD